MAMIATMALMLGGDALHRGVIHELIKRRVGAQERGHTMGEIGAEPAVQRECEALLRARENGRWYDVRDCLTEDPLSDPVSPREVGRERQRELHEVMVEKRYARFQR